MSRRVLDSFLFLNIHWIRASILNAISKDYLFNNIFKFHTFNDLIANAKKFVVIVIVKFYKLVSSW